MALIGIEAQGPGEPIGFPRVFQKTMSDFLQVDCGRQLIDETVGELLRSPPRLPAGQIDGYSLALMGRPRGLSFFVIGTLLDVRLLDKKTGFWLWKDTTYKIFVAMRVEIIDSATGTKALDETLDEEMVIDELRHEQLQQAGQIPIAEIDPILTGLMRTAGNSICSALRDKPWQGFVVGVDQDRITISSGRSAGLSSGLVLDVYGGGKMVENKDGQRFIKPGEKIGEATVSSVTDDRAEAVYSGSTRAVATGTVRPKP
jgi:hypothetical protein